MAKDWHFFLGGELFFQNAPDNEIRDFIFWGGVIFFPPGPFNMSSKTT